jgi:hypothetical protein
MDKEAALLTELIAEILLNQEDNIVVIDNINREENKTNIWVNINIIDT